MPPVNPAPGKGYVRSRPTPLVGDVLFYELRDRDVAANQTPPDYGSAHPVTRLWPNHKLVLVEPADTSGFEKWWYAADRDNQDQYNWEFTRDENRDLIVRTRIVPREGILWDSPSIGSGSEDPYVPADVFAGASGHLLVERIVKQIDDERISSLYVAEVLIYEKLPGETDTKEVDEGCLHYFEVTKRVPTDNPGTVPAGPAGSVLVSSTLEEDPKNPTVSIWTARYEVLPSGVWTELRTVGDANLAIVRQRVETATPGTAPSLPGGYEQLETTLKAQEQCLVSEWMVLGEELPGPIFETVQEQDGFETTTQTRRVLTSTPGTPPSAPSGQTVLKRTLDATDNNLVSRWVVESRDTVNRTESTSTSASVQGVVVQTRTLGTTQQAALPNTVSLSNEPQVRGEDGTVQLWNSAVANLTVASSSPPVSTSLDYRPGVTLRSLSTIVTAPVERSDVADYQNSLTERSVDGTPIAWREQVTTSAARPMTAGVEKDERPMVSLSTLKRYSTSSAVATPTGSSSVSYVDPTLTMFQVSETTAIGKERTIGVSKDARVGYTIETTESYSLNNNIATPAGSVDIAFDDGSVLVYKKGESRAVPRPLAYLSSKRNNPLVTSTVNSRIDTNPNVSTDLGDSTPVYVDRDTVIYRTDEITNTPNGSRTYGILITASVPAVLRGLTIEAIALKNGASHYRAIPDIVEGYTGAFQGRVTEYWTKTPPVITSTPLLFRPAPISVDLFRLSFSIGPTLHTARTITEVIGTEDPEFEQDSKTYFIPATEQTDIPTGWVPHSVDVDPMEDGFRVRQIDIKYR